MKLKGYLITHNNKNGFSKIKEKVLELGEKYYKFRHLYPVYLVNLDGNNYIYMESSDENINLINVLGFGFEGLIEDEDKINVIEEFGKYRCVVNSMNNIEINDQYIEVFKFEFQD